MELSLLSVWQAVLPNNINCLDLRIRNFIRIWDSDPSTGGNDLASVIFIHLVNIFGDLTWSYSRSMVSHVKKVLFLPEKTSQCYCWRSHRYVVCLACYMKLCFTTMLSCTLCPAHTASFLGANKNKNVDVGFL